MELGRTNAAAAGAPTAPLPASVCFGTSTGFATATGAGLVTLLGTANGLVASDGWVPSGIRKYIFSLDSEPYTKG
jgi:hypothetical protein